MSADFKTLLKQAQLPERSLPICLRGDLVADHEAAERDLEQAQRTPADSLAGSGTGELVDRIEALEADMREHTYVFRIRALLRRDWRALVDAHPPRRDPETGDPLEADAALGIDRSSFFHALIRACVVDPVLDDTEWAELLDDKLTDRQFGNLSDAAWFLNRGEINVPFSLAASRAKRTSADE